MKSKIPILTIFHGIYLSELNRWFLRKAVDCIGSLEEVMTATMQMNVRVERTFRVRSAKAVNSAFVFILGEFNYGKSNTKNWKLNEVLHLVLLQSCAQSWKETP